MINTELEAHYSLFSKSQGSGYIFDNENEITKYINPVSINVGSESISPGDMTDLDNYLSRKVKYLGLVNGTGMIFYYGSENNLFPKHYYGLIFRISQTRIFEMFSNIGGRDHNFINQNWK